MKDLLLLLLLCCAFLLNTGCATVINGTTQKVSFSTTPPGADVYVDGNQTCQTPCNAKLKRKTDHLVTFEKTGYKAVKMTVMHTISGAVAGNILAGGLIGWGIDALDGAQYKLIPAIVSTSLKSTSETGDTQNPALREKTVDERLTDLQYVHDNGGLDDGEYDQLRYNIIQVVTNGDPPTTGAQLPPDEKIDSLFKLEQKKLISEKEYKANKLVILHGVKQTQSSNN